MQGHQVLLRHTLNRNEAHPPTGGSQDRIGVVAIVLVAGPIGAGARLISRTVLPSSLIAWAQ